MIPMAYELKRFVARQRHRLRDADELAGIVTAPIYFFPDQHQFDSDEVDLMARQHFAGAPLHLPHEHVLFEVADRSSYFGAIVAYAVARHDRVDGYLLLRDKSRAAWSDVVCRASFLPDMVADVETDPSTLVGGFGAEVYPPVLTGVIWRAVALLAQGSINENRVLPVSRRPKLKKQGISGWTYQLITIDLAQVRAAIRPAGGTHASPRWHIRRGHWRTLADGRRIHVRDCEVGDPARGGVVKDYHVVPGGAG